MNGNGNVMETKPSGPSWNTAPNIDEEENTQEDDASAIAIATTDNQMNQYAPPTHNKQHAPTLTVEHMVAPEVGMSDVTPGLTRRISSKILYQEERLREQIRTAAQREKLAKKQANTQRIENERLERENEQLKFQINAARQAQADALHQSQEALTSIQPMRVENEKLKQAINQWKELIQTKDEELEALEAEVDQLRLENEKLENVLRDDKSKVDDIQFKLERSDALLQELTTKNRDCEAQINELMKDKVALEDDKRNLDLKVAQIKDEMKKLKRNQNSGLGLDRNSLKQKEADLFNISLNMTAAAPVVVENDDIVPPGSHDFNFMEEDEEEPAQPDEDPEEDEEEEEPEMIDKVIIEQSEVEEDVVKTVLFDDEYKASPWYMSVTDMTNYHKYFIQADLNKDGVIDGNEANKFFTKSKLNRKLLAKIWVLADQKKQAKLSEKMFCVMFHIVMKIKKSANKLSVPTELPACLTVDVVEKLGTKIQKTVKEKKIVNQKKIIKVENPNKKKKKKKKKSKPKPAQNENNKTNDALDFSDNWGNDTDSNWNQFDTKPTEKTETTQIAEQNGADSNWNEFGNFFDQ